MANLLSIVEAAEVTYSRKTAVVDGDRRASFADVADRSTRAAHVLRGVVGDGPGNIAVLVGNTLEAIELDLATIKAGLGRVSLNPRLSDDELAYIVGNSGARMLVYSSAYAGSAVAIREQHPDLAFVRVDDDGPGLPYEDALASAAATPARYLRRDEDASLLMYTSGTTGRPKGAVWTFATRLAGVRNMLTNELDRRASRVMLHVGSLSHGSGSKVVPVLARGGCSIPAKRFDADEFFALVRAHRVTASFMVPTMVDMLVAAAPDDAQDALASLVHVAYGGAKMPLTTIQGALDVLGERFVQVYGSCEAPHPVLFLDQDDHAGRDPDLLSSSGRPVVGVDIRMGVPSQPAEEGASGEILVRGPHLFAGYWDDPAATAEVFIDGFYRTGDIGEVRHDGVIEIVGRARDMIISGGFNVYPAEVERVLLEHDAVAHACVYGIRDPKWGEAVVAAVVPAAGSLLDTDDLAQHCGRRLAGYKKPRSFRVVDTLPLGPTGKVLRDEVRRAHDASVVGGARG